MGYGVINSDLMTTSDGVSSAGLYGFKNKIFNGDMRIDQRNAGAAVTVNNNADFFPVDRWAANGQSADGVFTAQQSSTVPAGFTNSIVCTVTTSDSSIGSSQRYFIAQKIEGLNIFDFGWGTAAAQTVTLSFWVRSSLTGTFGGSIKNSAGDRSYPFSYVINAANTWEQKTITIAGDTTGTWLSTNGVGLFISWSLGAGSSFVNTSGAWAAGNYFGATGQTNLIATNGATFYITGVQLEKGSTATSFDYRPYGTELQLCQRYYQVLASGSNLSVALGGAYTATSVYMSVPLRVSMRSAPTLSATTGTNYYVFYRNASNDQFNSLALESASTDVVELNNTTEISGTVGWAGMVRTSNASAFISFSSEL